MQISLLKIILKPVKRVSEGISSDLIVGGKAPGKMLGDPIVSYSLNSMLFLLYINMNKSSRGTSSSLEKAKRSSKISAALKNQFLTALTSKDITIKDVHNIII